MPFSADERAILAGGVGPLVGRVAKAIEAAPAHAPAGV
jgi:hypothetical protein